MATGFSSSSASQFPPLPSARSQSIPVVESAAGPTPASYSRAVTAVPENHQFADLEALPGKVVSLTRSAPYSAEFSGRVLFGDTPHGVIGVVDESNGQLFVFHTHSLDSLQILDQPLRQWTREERAAFGLTSDTECQRTRENRNLEYRRDLGARVGPEGTSPTVQNLFDSLSKTLSCAWNGNDIVIHDVRIHPPYRPENCVGSNRISLNRIQKMVAAEWKKFDEST